ncbi:FecR domain-containing protein [Pseudomonas chlororaphis]|uniref:FecR domain-containing protein n=1 Tax=Pseudomonas chlororaphis TaxID=587753 RepID=UPI002367F243|nr:FecR domain-containing protein [Pseudomonas chlororaphis]WDG78840.1 FecR domain-containing protein [Pseudomonas chlororaphis]WDG87973.1 FecR domain-containing protein [Pseudomonas chlororaphis]
MSGVAVDPRVRDSAIDWMVRAQSGLMSADEHQALQQWRQASAEHEYAWQRVSSLPLVLQPGANLLADATARRALESAGADPQRRRQVLKCLLALGLLGGISWQGADSTLVRSALATYRTSIGERRRWALADGGSLWLNTASAVNLELTQQQGRVQLIEGEMALDTRAESPAVQLLTPDAVLYSRGAHLLVRHDRQGTQVTVLRGLVQVSARRHWLPVPLEAGWQTRVDSQGVRAPSRVDLFMAQAWLRGILPAERMRLDKLLAELSRYRPGLLRCSEEVAALRVTGSFQLDDTDAALALVANTLPVRIARRTRYWVTVVPA